MNSKSCHQVLKCHIEFTDNPCKYSTYGQRYFNSQQQLVIDSEVGKLLQLSVISQSVHEQEECLSPIFVVPKPDGSHRRIFNFKSCNEAVLFRHFKMDSYYYLIRPDVYMASLDLKHAYYTIPIAAEHRKDLKFVWGGQLYEFKSLPMGFTSSPRIFNKIMKPVLASLRQKGYTYSGYIDDVAPVSRGHGFKPRCRNRLYLPFVKLCWVFSCL